MLPVKDKKQKPKVPSFDEVMQDDYKPPKVPSYDEIMGETPKKKVGSVSFDHDTNVLSQSGGVDGEEIPTIEMYTAPNGEIIQDPFKTSKQYNELSNATKEVSMPSSGKGGQLLIKVPDEFKRKEAQALREELKKSGIDADELYNETKDIPDEILNPVKGDLLNDRVQNQNLYQRKIARLKWSNDLNKTLLESVVSEDDYKRIMHQVKQLPLSTGSGDYSNQRGAVQSLAKDIQLYGGANKDKILENFAVEVSKVYGSAYKNNFDKYAADAPESKYLNNDEQLALQYLKDVAPDKAGQYDRLMVDPKTLKDNPDALKGYNHLKQTLEETGIGLQQNAVTEELNSLKKQAELNGGLTEEQLAKATELEKKQDELTQKRNELDVKYPDRIEDKVDNALNEIMGEQKLNWGEYAVGRTLEAGKNTVQGAWELVSKPFKSDASNVITELEIMGDKVNADKFFSTLDKNKALQTDQLVIDKDLQTQIDAVKSNGVHSKNQKRILIEKLLRDNPDKFGRVPIKGGKFNVNPSSILYGVTDIATTLVPFMAIEAATGGIGGAGAAAKFLRTANAAFVTSFHDHYAESLLNGKSESEAYREAMGTTAITAFAMAGAGTPDAIRAMAGMKTSAGKIIAQMSDDAIQKVLSKGTPKGMKAIGAAIKDRAKATPQMFVKGLEGGAKFETAMALGNEAKSAIYDTEIDREQNFKQSMLGILNFGVLGTGLGQAGYKSPTRLQKDAFMLTGKNPAEYISLAEKMKKDGLMTEQQFEQTKTNIENSAAAYKSLPTKLDERQKAEYLYQTVIKNEANKGKSDLPPKQAAEAEKTALVADYNRQLILEEPTDKQLESRKSSLEKKLEPKKDADGKVIEIPEKEKLSMEAELEAVNNAIEGKEKEVVDTKLSEPVEGLNEQGIPIGKDVPPPTEVKNDGNDIKLGEASEVNGVPSEFGKIGVQKNKDGYSAFAEVSVEKKGATLTSGTGIGDKGTVGEVRNFKTPEEARAFGEEFLKKKYSEQSVSIKPEIKNEEAKVTQDTNAPTTTGKEQSMVTDPTLKTEAGEGKKEPPKEPTDTVKEGAFVEDKRTLLSHRGLQEVATEFGLPDINSRDRKTDQQLFKDAEQTATKWNNEGKYPEKVDELVKKAEDAEILTDEQRVILQQHIANVRVELSGMDIKSPEYDGKLKELQRLVLAGEKTRSAAGAALRVPFMSSVPNDLPSMMVEEMRVSKTGELTAGQKETVQKEYKDISETEKAYQEKVAALEAENAKLRAGKKVAETKSTTPKTKKVHEDFVNERKKITESISEKLKKARQDTNVVIVPYAKELIAITPDVAKLLKSYVEEGVLKLEDITKKIHDELKGYIPDLKEKDVHDIIAGVYNEKKQTKNQIAEQIENIRIQAKLVNKLESILAGGEPKAEKKKIKRNAEIEKLRQQIKDFEQSKKDSANAIKDAEKEAERFAKEAEREQNKIEAARLREAERKQRKLAKDLEKKTPEEIALQSLKTKMANEKLNLEMQLRTGNFSKPEKVEPIKLDKEALELRDKLIQLRQNREVRLLLAQRMSETGRQRGMRLAAEVLNIPRTLMTIGDYSGLLRQNIFFTAGHPIMSSRASKEMFKAGWSQKEYDRWFADYKESPRYRIKEKSRLAISDSLSHDLTKREEVFMSSLAEKIPLIGKTLRNKSGNTIIPGLNIVKGSERSYTALLNKIRSDMFDYFADSMEARGLTYENSKKQYEAMAEYINNATGRSDFGETLNRVAPILNGVFFSPRLIASRVNMLSYWMQPRFWKTLPKEVRIDYMRNWISLLAVGGTLMAVAKLGGADVEEDPRSSDFGKIKSGNTRWDIWGGAQPYVRVVAQVATGKRKSTTSGKLFDLNGDDIFGETKAGVVTDFFRNKLAPVPGAGVDILSGRTGIGDKIVYQWGGAGDKEISIDQYIKQRLLPMTITGTEEAWKDFGVKSLFTVGIPNTFGVGTQTYESKASKEAFTEEEKKDPTIKYFSERDINFSQMNPEKIVTKEVNNKPTERLSDYDQKTQDDYIKAKKKYLKEGLQELKDGYLTIYKDEDGGVSIPSDDADLEGKEPIAFKDLTDEQLQYLVSQVSRKATIKTKEEIDLKSRKKKDK